MSSSLSLLDMQDLDLDGQRVVIREDLNVPIKDGKIISSARIQRALPTLRKALKANARVIVLSHFGRPKEGEFDSAFSLAPVAEALSQSLNQEVLLVKEYLDGVDVAPGQIVLCENVRFNLGEKANDAALSKQLAKLCDVFVMDAFATAHRAQASTVGIAEYAPVACAGPLLLGELKALSQALEKPKHPVVAVVGGSKVSTKIQILDALLDKVDVLIVGGGIANTFLAAAGHPVGKSLYEADWVEPAKQLLEKAKTKNVSIPLPIDVVVAKEFSEASEGIVKNLTDVSDDDLILDVGPETAKQYPSIMQAANTIVWNGPVGVFEFANFSQGTRVLGEAIAESNAFSIAGGGDTIAALDTFALSDRISYICTGGGAFLEYLEGRPLPAVVALEEYHGKK